MSRTDVTKYVDKSNDLLAMTEAAKTLRQALRSAKSTDDVAQIRNRAEAIRSYAKQAKDRTLEIDAAELRIRSERKLGQLIHAQRDLYGLSRGAAEKGVGRRGKRGSAADPRLRKLTLADVNIDKHLADEARKLAALPEVEFEGRVAEWRKLATMSNRVITVKLFRTRKNSPEMQIPLFEASSNILSASGRKLERVLLQESHADPAHQLDEKTGLIIKTLVDGVRLLEASAQQIAMPGAVERFQADFAAMEERVVALVEDYRASSSDIGDGPENTTNALLSARISSAA